MQAAAAWLVECPDPAEEQASWQAAQQRQAAEAAEEAAGRAKAKQQIVQRFFVRPVSEASGDGKRASGSKREELQVWGAGGSGEAQQKQANVSI